MQEDNWEHANNTNPCQGICVEDGGYCIGCLRSIEERSNWYDFTNEEREQILVKLAEREKNGL